MTPLIIYDPEPPARKGLACEATGTIDIREREGLATPVCHVTFRDPMVVTFVPVCD